jgi:hypothetical protein
MFPKLLLTATSPQTQSKILDNYRPLSDPPKRSDLPPAADSRLLQAIMDEVVKLRKEVERLNGQITQMRNEQKASGGNRQSISHSNSLPPQNNGMGGSNTNSNVKPNFGADNNSNSFGNANGSQTNLNSQRSNMSGMTQDRQSRMQQNDYGTPNANMRAPQGGNINTRQNRPQSTDPGRSSNIQSHNFAGMNMGIQQPHNDDKFFGNAGVKGGPVNSSSNIGDDGIDWGL